MSATKAPFISYDDEPLALLGQNPAIELIEKRPGNFAGEAGVTQPGTNNSYMFITVLPFAKGSTTTDRLPQGLWRWDPQKKTLWVTDFGGDERSRIWGLPAQVGAPAIYKYDLNEDMWPVNKRIFGVSGMQAPDGIRIDDKGRVWTGEGEGVVVRSSQGKVIGVFNGQFFTRDSVNTAIVQFELARDVLVVLGQNKLRFTALNNLHQLVLYDRLQIPGIA
ncbi:gluconolactonase [Colletotrichum abscissum]